MREFLSAFLGVFGRDRSAGVDSYSGMVSAGTRGLSGRFSRYSRRAAAPVYPGIGRGAHGRFYGKIATFGTGILGYAREDGIVKRC